MSGPGVGSRVPDIRQLLHYAARVSRAVKRQNCIILGVVLVILVLSLLGSDTIGQLYETHVPVGPNWLTGSGSDTVARPAASFRPENIEASPDPLSAELENTGSLSVPQQDLKAFYHELLAHLNETTLPGKLQQKPGADCKTPELRFDSEDFEKLSHLTGESLLKCSDISEDQIKQMKEGHADFKKLLQDKIIPNFNKMQSNEKRVYKGEGIAILGGGKYSLTALPVIRSIRMNSGIKLKNTVPIELIIPPSDSEDRAVCENILPTVDPTGLTKCVYLSDYFDHDIINNIGGYQLKPISLLVSSFEKVLFLDADNYVINSLGDFFDSDILRETGIILWPDFWRRVHSPRLYEIVDINVQQKVARFSTDYITNKRLFPNSDPSKVPFHDLEGTIPEGSTESGQILVDKSRHLDTIILSLYYNFNGPSHYYKMLSQGTAGEGDKDTFILAASALRHRYYQVRSPVSVQGHWAEKDTGKKIEDSQLDKVKGNEKSYRGVAMVQHDYIEDKKFDSVARETIGNTLNDKMKTFRLKWIKDHKDDFKDMNEKDALKKVSDMNDVSDKFWDSMKGKYSLKDFFAFFQFTTPTFLHSNLPKYNPWELYQSKDFIYKAKPSNEKDTNAPESVPHAKGHYRMYNAKFNELTNYDLELANWSIFQDVLCKTPDDYRAFSYLTRVIGNTKNPAEEVRGMCSYIKDRVEYLKQSTWENSLF